MTAPMEAEAQCAELVHLGLVEGIITDDSDVFLFGGNRVFRNMFNQSKTVECFLSSDLVRELGLDRGTLVRLAHLLGSDYTEGLAGVGPVMAMELVKEFPSDDGLERFAEWWRKVQSGRDKKGEGPSKFKKSFVSACLHLFFLLLALATRTSQNDRSVIFRIFEPGATGAFLPTFASKGSFRGASKIALVGHSWTDLVMFLYASFDHDPPHPLSVVVLFSPRIPFFWTSIG